MKYFFYLSAFLLATSFFLYQSTSYTTAIITNDLIFTISSEENAFIAISYGPGKKFAVTNNTAEAIVIDYIGFTSETKHEINPTGNNPYPNIHPGGKQDFNIKNNPHELLDKTIRILVSWNGGSAEIFTDIPLFGPNSLELDEEETDGIDEDIDEENVNIEGSESDSQEDQTIEDEETIDDNQNQDDSIENNESDEETTLETEEE